MNDRFAGRFHYIKGRRVFLIKRAFVFIGIILLFFSVAGPSDSFAFTMESQNYSLPAGAIGGSGTFENSSSSNYELYYNIGQMSPAGSSESSNYMLRSGYIYTLFDDIYIYDVSIDGSSASSVTSISSNPVIEADILDECLTPGSTSVEVSVDGNKYLVGLIKTGPRKYHFSFSPGMELSGATHEVIIRAKNLAGSADYYGVKKLKQAGLFSVTSRPKNVPNPFKPRHGEGTTIMYNLSSGTGTKLIVYDITGKAIWQRSFESGTEGGKSGLNNVFWDGKNDFGEYVGNGVYIYTITSGSKILHKGQMAVMD
jgi:hypothetical protein